jgi:RND family efflux transporter MFP subunit
MVCAGVSLRAGFLLPLLLVVAACDRAVPEVAASEASGEPAQPVTLAKIDRGEVERPIRAAGLVTPRHNADMAFKVGGVVSAVLVEDGTRVKKGQVIARIDPTEYSAGAAQAKRSLDQAERDLSRAKALHADKTVARATLEGAETAEAIARSQYAAAAFNERHTVLTAPSDGVIERRMVELGEVVAPGRPVARFLGTERGWIVSAAVSDRDALRLPGGGVARVVLDAAPDKPLEGTITDVARLANPRTGTFQVEITLPRELPFEPRSGLVAKVTIPTVERPPATVPISALLEGDRDKAFVFVADGGKAKRVPVRVAFLTADRAALSADIAGYDAVVVEGQTELVDGAPLRAAGQE